MFRVGDHVQALSVYGPPPNRCVSVPDTVYEVTDISTTPYINVRPIPPELQPTDEGKKYARCGRHGGWLIHFSRLIIFSGVDNV